MNNITKKTSFFYAGIFAICWTSQASAVVLFAEIGILNDGVVSQALAESSRAEYHTGIDLLKGHAELLENGSVVDTDTCTITRSSAVSIYCFANAVKFNPTVCEYCNDHIALTGITYAQGWEDGVMYDTLVNEQTTADIGRSCDWWEGNDDL